MKVTDDGLVNWLYEQQLSDAIVQKVKKECDAAITIAA